jgi:hypothetical protein
LWWIVGVALDFFETRFRGVERQVRQPLETRVLGQDALGCPTIVGLGERDLDVFLRMHPEQQHRGWKHDLIVDPHRIHGAAGQLGEMVAALGIDRFQ